MKNKKQSSALSRLISSRNARRGAFSAVVTALVIAAVILLNIFVTSLSSRYSLYADMTVDKVYRLQDVTAEFAASVEKDTELIVLASETVFEGYGDYYVQANRLIHQLSECSPHISLRYVDLTSDPAFPHDYPDVNWEESHLCLVVCGERYRVIDADDFFEYEADSTTYSYVITEQHIEQALASAVMVVTSDELTVVSVLKGQSEEDMTPFLTKLKNNAYEIEEVDLNTGKISDESEFLIIYAPSVDIDDDMAEYISDWLENGGDHGHNLIYFPDDRRDVAEYPNLNALIGDYGMSVSYGYIYEADQSFVASSLNTALCSRYIYADSEFTADLPNADIPVYLFYTMPIEITDSNLARAMLTSSEKAFFGPISNENKDDFTPDYHAYNGAAIGTKSNEKGSSSVVVVGSYDALSEGFLDYNSYNNSAYFVNVFNKLSSREAPALIIEGKNLDSTALGADSAATVSMLAALARYVIPLAILLAGILVFFLRRYR